MHARESSHTIPAPTALAYVTGIQACLPGTRDRVSLRRVWAPKILYRVLIFAVLSQAHESAFLFLKVARLVF